MTNGKWKMPTTRKEGALRSACAFRLRVGSSFLPIVCLQQFVSDFDRHAKVGTAKALIPVDRGKYRGVDRNDARIAIEDGTARSAFGCLCTVNDSARQSIADRPGGGEGSYQAA